MSASAYELVFVRQTGAEEHEDVVVVRPTGASGPGGHPVFADDTGVVRAEISDRGEIRMLATGGHQDLEPPRTVREV
ncbi:DUF6296 family protein [Kitasatospora sp. NPDC052896]|uniref:DUF6296 family protein n=1 Tax=Kitasatospora sp. NPDC052896 TaxID=3364061 RepID=UPI0037C8B88A